MGSIAGLDQLASANHSANYQAANDNGNHQTGKDRSVNGFTNNGVNDKSEYGRIMDSIQNGKMSIPEFFALCESYQKSNLNTTEIKDFVDYYLMSNQYLIETKLLLLNHMEGKAMFLNDMKLYAAIFVEGLVKQGVDWDSIHNSCHQINRLDSRMAAYEKLYKLQFGQIDQLKFLVFDEKRMMQIREIAAIQNNQVSGDSISARFFANIFENSWVNSPRDSDSYTEIMNAIESLNVEERFKNLIVWKFSGKNKSFFDEWRNSKGKYLNLNEAELKRMYAN